MVQGFGCEVEVVDYAPPEHARLWRPDPRHLLNRLCKNPRSCVGQLRSFSNSWRYCRAASRDFHRLPLGRRVTTPEELGSLNYDRVILGSDEIWNLHNPFMAGDLAYFGRYFSTDSVSAYAPSCGSVRSESELSDEMCDSLKQLHHLSARDRNTAALLSTVGLDSTVVLDPTLVGQRVPQPESSGTDLGSVVVYAAPLSSSTLDELISFTVGEGAELLSIIHPQSSLIRHHPNVDSKRFLEFFSGAGAIITNTFHGVIFSVLSGKPFVVIEPGLKVDKICDLLGTLGLEDRLIKESNLLGEVLRRPLPRATLNERLEEASAVSLEFLKNAVA